MEKQQQIIDYCRRFRLSGLLSELDPVMNQAQREEMSYVDYTIKLFAIEARHREAKDLQRRSKAARLPLVHDLDQYDYAVNNGLSKTMLLQLRELNWIEQLFNLVLMGPSGTGKTFIAAGLCNDAVKYGYRAYFRTMEDIVNILKMKDITRSANADYKRLCKAQLIVIDDIMMFPIQKEVAVSLFNFINQLFEKTSFVITTNKAPKQWAQMLDDEVLASALLDRLLFRCEVVNLSGNSYRMENRETIFEK
ncbi:MAG: IS21-like element helper ATPase IstB [Bacteroidales bacterium]|nr:IS21-like element helper ATPase IstB [Bacteroidales bacterium]